MTANITDTADIHLGVIGCGTMGCAILNGLLRSPEMVRTVRSVRCSVSSEGRRVRRHLAVVVHGR